MKNLRKNTRNYIFGLITFLLLGAIFLAGCKGTEPEEEEDVSKLVPTYAAQTLQALSVEQTITAYETAIAQITQTAQVTPTPEEVATETDEPAAPTSTPTAQTVPCNWVDYVMDITISDYTSMEPETAFTKTWRLKNIGSCTWTTDYDLVFVSGNSMSASTRIGLPASVAPGQSIDLSVLMEAPQTDGVYAGYWKLADANGNQFGIGPNADGNIWVKITVASPPHVVYDFTENYCDARWYSRDTKPASLPCPGDETDDVSGFVVYDSTPKREGGGEENEPGLILSPDNGVTDGRIVGVFPAFEVKTGDVFKAVFGCAYGSSDCDLRFDLIVQIEPEVNETLGTWYQVYDGKVRSISVDLSEYAGQEITFIFRIRNNGTADDNEALLLYPRIIRQ